MISAQKHAAKMWCWHKAVKMLLLREDQNIIPEKWHDAEDLNDSNRMKSKGTKWILDIIKNYFFKHLSGK